jgi:SAM-dependent methyltransferase
MSPLAMDDAYFVQMYATDPDPWGFDSSWYEQRKYALTLAALPERRYERAVEPGCANGAFTALLADRCDRLYAYDLLDATVERARRRLAHRGHVDVRRERFPGWWPDGSGDLVVWSEIAYYLDGKGADEVINGLDRWLRPGGDLVAVHYTGATNYPRTGAAIGAWLDEVPFLERTTTLSDPQFDLGVWRRSAPSRGASREEDPT